MRLTQIGVSLQNVPPSGGSLEIGNETVYITQPTILSVPPSGGSLEIGNKNLKTFMMTSLYRVEVPPSGGSLEIGNTILGVVPVILASGSPFGGIPRNWKQHEKA